MRACATLATTALALASSCGASPRMVHQSVTYFELCHGADLEPERTTIERRECWSRWLMYYKEGQPPERVAYAHDRMRSLQRGETLRPLPGGVSTYAAAYLSLGSEEPGTEAPATSAAPAEPATAEPASTTPAPTASEPADPAPAATEVPASDAPRPPPVTPRLSPPIREGSSPCLDVCNPRWDACVVRCDGRGSECINACRVHYRVCVGGCF